MIIKDENQEFIVDLLNLTLFLFFRLCKKDKRPKYIKDRDKNIALRNERRKKKKS